MCCDLQVASRPTWAVHPLRKSLTARWRAAPYVAFRAVKELFAADRFDELLPDARRFEEGMPNFPAMFVATHWNSCCRSELTTLQRITAG
jgi:hypothetical protein